MAGAFEFDASEFLAGLKRGGDVARSAAADGMRTALLDLERRAKEKTPVDQGTLQRGIHARTTEIVVEDDRIEGVVATGAESSDYAIVQHEETLAHTHPVKGTYAAKYIEGPLRELGPTYGRSLAAAVRGALGT